MGLPMRSEAPEGDPRASGSFQDDRPEVQKLFEMALEARLPRSRELKPWEPARLNERHLAMVFMRAGGPKQREIAQAFGATDSNVSIVLNHPDAEYLLSRLQAMRASRPTAIEERLAALQEPAMQNLEAAFGDEPEMMKLALKRAPLAFRVLELNGHGRKPAEGHVHEHEHRHHVDATPEQLGALTRALRESRQVREIDFVEYTEVPPGGESEVSPPPELLAGTGAPSFSDSQEVSSTTPNAPPGEESEG